MYIFLPRKNFVNSPFTSKYDGYPAYLLVKSLGPSLFTEQSKNFYTGVKDLSVSSSERGSQAQN
jgi:hypothetical protein